jgi:Macrocin-O-methyltransferase (TylF)
LGYAGLVTEPIERPPRFDDVAGFFELRPDASLEHSYLHLLKLCLTGLSSAQPYFARPVQSWRELRPEPLQNLRPRIVGSDWPIDAWTMVGVQRLDNVQHCVDSVIADGVPGDMIETGVWRGGTTIFMRALLKVHGDADRTVFVADSFEGLPPPNPEKWPADSGSPFHEMSFLRVPVEDVQSAFRRFGLLDDQVEFVEGWFEDTLPKLRDHTWSVIRLDGDMYGSTMTSLENLYPGLSPGGYVIIDDFRQQHGLTEAIQQIDWTGHFWRKDS